MIHDYLYYFQFLSRVKRLALVVEYPRASSTLETYMSRGIGIGPNGETISQTLCGNNTKGTQSCFRTGIVTCAQCSLIKYCSDRCQRQHWSKHRLDCEHPYMDPQWEPEWMTENRQPLITNSKFLPSSSSAEVYKNPGIPAYDCLNLIDNEGLDDPGREIKVCMAFAADIRNLLQTVNSIPNTHHGKIDILMNNSNVIVVNRMLIILSVLLTPGPTIEESAELATQLMYSAFLPEAAAAYVATCTDHLYTKDSRARDMSFQRAIDIRGSGRLFSAQPASGIKRMVEMLHSEYPFARAATSMKNVFQDPFYADDQAKLLVTLQPAHRLALHKFWQTGVLAPFAMDIRHFKAPNRLMFTPQGEWMGMTSAVNPLHGWDIASVQRTGLLNGCDPTGDILGCLFFHVKTELREFATRMKERNITIHILQYNSRLLSKGISVGVLPEFSDGSFDRVDIGDMSDQAGVADCLADWAPLLNHNNEKACLLMHSKKWHEESPSSIARDNPDALKILKDRCRRVSIKKPKLQPLFNGSQNVFSIRLMSSLDAFVDHERAFLKYLEQMTQFAEHNLGVNLRQYHHVHPKRIGIPLHRHSQKLPNLSKDEFYQIFILGGADLTIRFAEFEARPITYS